MKKSQFSHWVLPLATICSMMSSSSAFAQEYDFSLQGYFNPSCGGGFFERVEQEGMPFQFDVELSIDSLMGEPVVRSSAIWNSYGFGVSCIEPYNQDGLVRLTNLRQYDPEGKSHPYNMDLVAELVGPSIQGQTFLSFNPGALSATSGEEGYNTSGSPNWNRFLFMMPSGSFDFWNTDLYQYLPADAAKEIFRSGFSVSEVTVADVDFDMSAAKSNFGMRAKTANTLETVANRLADWGSDTFEAYPEDVAQRIKTDAALPVPENSAALRKTIDDIQALHRNLAQKGGKENVEATMDALHENLQPFLQAVDEPDTKEEFWQILFKSEMDAAQMERETIAAEIAAKALEVNTKPEKIAVTEVTPAPLEKSEIDYTYQGRSLAKSLKGVEKGIYETDCGQAGTLIRWSTFDKKTGQNSFQLSEGIPACSGKKAYERLSVFTFFVADISSYNVSGDKLTIGFDEKSLFEYYYNTDTLPETLNVKRSELVIWLNLEKENAISGLIQRLERLVSYRQD